MREATGTVAPQALPCDLCGASNPERILESPGLDGPLVRCAGCGLKYVGERRSQLTFGSDDLEATTARVRAANTAFEQLNLEEEHRLALLNAAWRLKQIQRYRSSGKLLEVGCARGDFLEVARGAFDAYGVEPNPELAADARQRAPIHEGVIETLPWSGFDVAVSFHVIEHVDSPSRYVAAIASRLNKGGLLVLETPNIQSRAFRLSKSRWRQFIPEHYYFFDPETIVRLLEKNGFEVKAVDRIGKYASMALIANRLSRYFRPAGYLARVAQTTGLSKLTFRMNPSDIMIAYAVRR